MVAADPAAPKLIFVSGVDASMLPPVVAPVGSRVTELLRFARLDSGLAGRISAALVALVDDPAG